MLKRTRVSLSEKNKLIDIVLRVGFSSTLGVTVCNS